MDVRISHDAYQAMLAHLRFVYPEEGCGILGAEEGILSRHFPIENIRHSPASYQMHPAEQVKALLEVDTAEVGGFAIYHSHPQGPATPSTTDLVEAAYPEAIYLIISLAQPEQPLVRAYSIEEGLAREQVLKIGCVNVLH
jgi:proteasome lid subunit RPN8/RPN11